jgi:YegS/Rv2252/BmrU family lipid kinase
VARALLITNPAAARTEPLAVTAVMQTLRARGWQAEVLATGGPGDARRLAEYGVEQGVDVVAVFGGDGTTMQAAAALVGSDVALGIIPGGTGNLLAGNLRIPPWPGRAAQVLARGRSRRLDLGRMSRDGGTQYFAVACGAGMDARVMAGTASERKRRWGMGAYVATTLRLIAQVRSTPHHLTVDGMEYDANAAMILVANCGEVIPPFVRLKSGIRPDDGLLDVIVLRADNLGQSVRAVWDLLREPAGHGGPGSFVGYARGEEITIAAAEGPEPVQLDGESAGETPFTATVVPGAIRIMVP